MCDLSFGKLGSYALPVLHAPQPVLGAPTAHRRASREIEHAICDTEAARPSDPAIWRGQDSLWYIKQSSDGQPLTQLWGANYAPYFEVPAPADYDGDGKAGIAVWRPTDGTWYVKRSSNNTNFVQTHGQPGDTPVPAHGVR